MKNFIHESFIAKYFVGVNKFEYEKGFMIMKEDKVLIEVRI